MRIHRNIEFAIFIILIIFTLFSPLSFADPSIRILHFPPDRSMGRLYVREFGKTGYHDWQQTSEAIGDVELPEDMERSLQLSREGCADLSPLSALKPDDLQGLNFPFFPRMTESPLKNEQFVHISHLSSLKRLRLSHNPVTDTGLIHLIGLASLEELELAHTNITDAGLVHLKQLKSLGKLWIAQNQITDEGLIHIKNLPRLESLSLSDTQIRDAGLAHLAGMTSLRTLYLGETKTSSRGLKKLRSRLSDCTIYGSNTDGTLEVFLTYSIIFLAAVCGLTLMLDWSFIREKPGTRLITNAGAVGLLVFFATVLPMKIHNFRYGQESLWKEYLLIFGLAIVYATVIFLRHYGEILFGQKTGRTRISAFEKCLTSIVVLLLGYAAYWLAVILLTDGYFDGDMSMAFLVIIPIGIAASILVSLINGVLYRIILITEKT